jgi:hypothetical protein
MAEENDGLNGQLDVEGFGMRARVRGHDIIVVALIILLFLGVGYMVWDHERRDMQRSESLSVSQASLIDEVSTLTYVMSLSAEERAKLHLDIPAGLRKKMSEQKGEKP